MGICWDSVFLFSSWNLNQRSDGRVVFCLPFFCPPPRPPGPSAPLLLAPPLLPSLPVAEIKIYKSCIFSFARQTTTLLAHIGASLLKFRVLGLGF